MPARFVSAHPLLNCSQNRGIPTPRGFYDLFLILQPNRVSSTKFPDNRPILRVCRPVVPLPHVVNAQRKFVVESFRRLCSSRLNISRSVISRLRFMSRTLSHE